MAKKKRKGPTPPRRVQHPAPGSTSSLFKGKGLVVALLVLAAALIVPAMIAFTRNDESDGAGSIGGLTAQNDPGPVHVHGLGINPADRSLFIATHTGMWRVGEGERTAKRVGESQQDTMGFTVVGPDHFLGSGHPDTTTLPPLLGLIESDNAAQTWQPISLLGEADFHVLRFAQGRVYGYDASNDRLLVSTDSGRSWSQVIRPAPLIDLAVDPRNSKRVIAAGESGLHISIDTGRNWKRLASVAGLLAWPSPNRLYLVEGSGSVLMSRDAGDRWNRVGNIRGQPAALLGQGAAELYVALHDGTIKRSTDGGASWNLRSSP
jgi:hypothetical protein